MWTRSAASKITGKFAVTCTDWNGETFFTGEFDNAADADKAGESAERRMTLAMTNPVTTLDEMSDDDLLREILA